MISVVVLTYNAATHLPALLDSLATQTIDHELIIIDSSSTDKTTSLLSERGVKYYSIDQKDFNHGGTWNLGVSLTTYEDIVLLTQDAIPAEPNSLEKLVAIMNSQPAIGMAYGRQLAYPKSQLMSQFARLTNYPSQSIIKSKADIAVMGIRTCHCSNSFAAYRKSVLLSVGGFPTDTIIGEDVVIGARLIQAGYSIAYCADTQVYHSHDYTIREEFKRYFDIGAFHQQQRPLLRPFQRAESQGFKYVLAEWRYLYRNNALSFIPSQLLRTGAKYIGYRLGRMYQKVPNRWKFKLSMHPNFWISNTIQESDH
ncbi:glycosyltransferase family 2 protein [Spirosoma sp. KNUC1025]|uniref:glycosyltransferase family 2 protein n=1 Tax=Spirosoma sp. KNUC1025 TaxID=2894082 RepID=UPI00386CD449|nr:glycosyltransferase [Spirosoma sp. KNUC1025]